MGVIPHATAKNRHDVRHPYQSLQEYWRRAQRLHDSVTTHPR